MATPNENNSHQPVLSSTEVSRKRKREEAEGNSIRKANSWETRLYEAAERNPGDSCLTPGQPEPKPQMLAVASVRVSEGSPGAMCVIGDWRKRQESREGRVLPHA